MKTDTLKKRREARGPNSLALVVEDDPYLVKVICFILRQHYFDCVVVSTGRAALAALEKRRPDVMFLDLLLPDMDGFELIALVRQLSPVPILVMTALPDSHNMVKALELGADDYLSKPLEYEELVARAKALVRRVALNVAGHGRGILLVGNLRVDLAGRKVAREGLDLDLAPIHWRLLYHLLVRRGSVVPYDELRDSVWPGQPRGLPYLRQWVSRLRRVIGDTEARIIRNIPEQGYIIESNVYEDQGWGPNIEQARNPRGAGLAGAAPFGKR